jgi:hypothetical protein
MTTAYALACPAPDGGRHYLAESASRGNLMRTGSPCHAKLWSSLAGLRAWAAELELGIEGRAAACNKTRTRVRIVAFELTVVEVAITVGAAVEPMSIRTLEPTGLRKRDIEPGEALFPEEEIDH